MADAKLTALTEDTTPGSDSVVYSVDDPSGTPVDRKVTAANLITKAHGLSDELVKVSSGAMTNATAGTDYYAPGGTDVALADGGTGASTASAARTNLGLDAHATYKSKTDATGAPGSTNDTNEGYSVGSLWVDVTADKSYICVDATASNAVWNDLTATAGGGIGNVVEDTTPQLGGQLDVNGNAIGDGTNELLTFTEDASAVNHVNIENEATGSGPIISAAGDDTNVDLNLAGKGSGAVKVGGTAVQVQPSEGAFVDGDKTKLDGIEASADVTDTANVTAAGALMDSELTDIAAVKATSDAVASDVNTGTDTAKFITPDALSGSNYGIRVVSLIPFLDSEDVATGDGAGDVFWRVPSTMNGFNLVGVAAQVQTAGTTGTTDVQIHNVTQAADMLTTKITIDSAETDSSTAATAAVIDTANDDVATGDQIRIDVDAVSTTAPKGLLVELQFQLP